jgi:hypothetical protein
MADDALILSAIKYRYRLDAQSGADIERLLAAYKSMAARLKDKIDLLIAEIEKAGVDNLTRAQVAKMSRYTQLIAAIRDELNKYNIYLETELNGIANTALLQATRDIQNLIRLSAGRVGISGSLNRLPVGSIKTLLGFLSQDSPLYQRLHELAPDLADRIAARILEGVGLGYNPMKVGDIITNELGWGLTDAMRWARTTQMWTYREASRATMAANSDVLDGWVWFAILDDAVPPCESCLANHGQLFPLEETLDDHYNGRCVAIPHVIGDDNPVSQSGEDWFRSLPADKQAEVLGQSKLAALNEGKFEFSQLTQQTQDDVFGTMRVGVSLKDLTGE